MEKPENTKNVRCQECGQDWWRVANMFGKPCPTCLSNMVIDMPEGVIFIWEIEEL
jgi:Zn finger protein HypA/HybF involved in hydrogenase expression